jgi:methylmalonyl-CoA mutase
MTTALDPYVTMLRETLATFAAGVGGADAVTVLPFDAPLGLPGRLSRRLARNTSTVLVEESHVAAVTDPAGGSWFVEHLTQDLAQAAWQVFQEIERAGGLEAGLRHGAVADRLAASAAAKLSRLATRKDAITGVSEFPFLDEKPLVRQPAPTVPVAGGLPRLRWSQEHEALRAAGDAHLAATGSRPTVLALTVGPLRSHVARLDFVRNLLLPGGIVTADADASAVPVAVPPVVVVVATDDVTPEQVAPAVAAARAAGATKVLRGGRPGEAEAAWRAAGIDDFVFLGGDALALLRQTHHDLGVQA